MKSISIIVILRYFAFSTTSTRRQRLVLLSGRLSMILTTSDGALVLLIMSVEAGGLLYKLPVDRVLHLPFNRDGDGLIHFVALYHPDPCFTQISFNHCFSFLLSFINDRSTSEKTRHGYLFDD
jgi:hypothetical protein